MGYRLYATALNKNMWVCLGKLYGYITSTGSADFGYELVEELESAKYLHKLHKIKEFDMFGYGSEIKIELGTIQFKRFYNLYLKDYEKFSDYDVFFKDFDCETFCKNEKKICLNWEG